MKQKPNKPIPLFKYGIQKALLIINLVLVALMISPVKMNAAGPDSNSGSIMQQVTVTGTVKDENGLPMPGVNIVVEGTTFGSLTDVNGKYSITVPNANSTLVFSFVGYLESRVLIAGKTKVDVSLEPSLESLDEVVVVGYGTQKKKDVTSAISIVDADQMAKAPVANVTNALMGLTAGVEVTNGSGKPGDNATVRIRGVGSVNGTDPLYVIDGVPSSSSNVNTADIETIQVLKDAASCAIYGARGANGVIIITTKNGKSGAPKISYSGYYGFESPWKKLDLMNIQEWAAAVTENNTAGGMGVPPLASDIMNHINNGTPYAIYDGNVTDWQDEIFQTGAMKENNIDLSGGTSNGNYYFSLNQYGQDGIILDTPYERYSIRMNSNWTRGKFKFGENFMWRHSNNEQEDNFDGRSVIEEAIKMTPNVPVYNSSYQPGGFSGYNSGDVGHDASNPVATLLRRTAMNYGKTLSITAYGEYQIMNDLVFRSTVGYIDSESQSSTFLLATNMPPKSWANTTLNEGASYSYNWVLEHMLTYHKIIGKHDLTAMADMSTENSTSHNMGASGTTLQTEVNNVLSLLETGYAVSGGDSENSRISYLGRVMYSYNSKYLFTANIRRDGSSKFGPGNKWGTFPSASVAWRVSEEPFLKNISVLSNLKLKTSYGVVGNDSPVGSYSYIPTLSMNQNYTIGTSKMVGAILGSFVNQNLSWETVKSFDIGVEVGLFKGALEATIDYYNKKTMDMLLSVPLPPSSGSSGSIRKNLGSVLVRGLEATVTGRKSFGALNVTLTANGSVNIENKVLDMAGVAPIYAGGTEFGNVTKTEVGHSVGAFYMYKMLGVFSTQAEADAYTFTNSSGVTSKIQPNAKGGDIKFADLNNDGVINSLDQGYYGKSSPDFTYGATLTADYKGFDFQLFMQGILGVDIWSEYPVWMQGMHNNFNLGKEALARWQKDGDITNVPRAVRNDPNGNIKLPSTRCLFNGNYMRFKNVTLGYTLPKKITNLVKIENLRVYATGRNLLTFTKYPYYDPEVGGGNTSRSIDTEIYPQSRTIIMGIQLDF